MFEGPVFSGGVTMAGDDKNRRENRNDFIRALSVLSQIGITIIVCVAIGVFLGRLLDNLLGTEPWLLILFIVLGIAAAFKSIFDFAKKV
jgi:ATP synthase protein I